MREKQLIGGKENYQSFQEKIILLKCLKKTSAGIAVLTLQLIFCIHVEGRDSFRETIPLKGKPVSLDGVAEANF
jgi:hypothetical protein